MLSRQSSRIYIIYISILKVGRRKAVLCYIYRALGGVGVLRRLDLTCLVLSYLSVSCFVMSYHVVSCVGTGGLDLDLT